MVIQDKEGSIWEAHQTQSPPVFPWKYAEMGGELMGEVLSSGQLDVCQIHAYPKYPQRASHQVSRFFSGLHSG